MQTKLVILLVILWAFFSILSAQLLTEGFENAWPPAGWVIINAGSGNNWEQGIGETESSEGSNYMSYTYNSSFAANAWAISQGIPMVAGRTYRVEFAQKVRESAYEEYMKVTLGTAQTVAAQTITLLNYPSPGLTNTTYINRVSSEYTCLATGTYYLGVNCFSRRDRHTLFVDDIRFYETILNAPPAPAVLNIPLNTASGVMNDATFTWAPQSGHVNGYRVSFGTNNPPSNLVSSVDLGNVKSYTPPTMQYSTTYYWKIEPYNEFGPALDCPVWSFTTGVNPTIVSFPTNNSFDASVPTYGWHNQAVTGTRTWSYKTITTSFPQLAPHSAPGMACYNINGVSDEHSAILVSPPISCATATYTYNLSLWMIRESILLSYDDRIKVYSSAFPDLNHSPTLLLTINRSNALAPVTASTGWLQYVSSSIPFVNGTGNYIIIQAVCGLGNSIYVDDINLSSTLIPIPPLPCEVVLPLHNAINVELTTDFSWQPTDAEPTGYRIYLGTNNPPTDILNGLDVGNVLTYNPIADLKINSHYYWKVVPYSANGSTLNCPVWSFMTIQTPAISTFPYVINFDQFLPENWVLNGLGEANWGSANTTNAGGTFPEARISFSPSFTGISRLVSPIISTNGMDSLRLSFRHKYSHFSGIYEIGVATRSGNGDWNIVWSHANSSIGPMQVTLDINNADIGELNTQICFYVSGNSYNMNYWYIDDIFVNRSGVGIPQNVDIDPTIDGVSLSWDTVTDATGYYIWSSSNPHLAFDPLEQINWHKVQELPVLNSPYLLPSTVSKEFFRVTATQ